MHLLTFVSFQICIYIWPLESEMCKCNILERNGFSLTQRILPLGTTHPYIYLLILLLITYGINSLSLYHTFSLCNKAIQFSFCPTFAPMMNQIVASQ